ncbi:hypothetical protein AgCh_037342 [Apium graveolens]
MMFRHVYIVTDFKFDPQLSLGEKRQIVHEIALWAEDAHMVLSSLTRRELLEIICAEMGQERKYSGYSKNQMIEHLLKLISKNYEKRTDKYTLNSAENGCKRQRTQEQLCHAPVKSDYAPQENMEAEIKISLCANLACRAAMGQGDKFCKRCSCCICHRYDDNKDPSLWLTCESDALDSWESCGVTCHLECALKHEKTGIYKNEYRSKLDGGFYCLTCGKINGLMRTWKKQLLIAKEARRVDVLCFRVSLGCKILRETEKYKELLTIVESCVKALEKEVGALEEAAKKMDRHIVNRLSCGNEVQKLCTYAVEVFDSMSPDQWFYHIDQKGPPTCRIHFQESDPNSVVVVLDYKKDMFENFLGCRLWHRKSTAIEYPKEATSIVLMPGKTFKLSNLDPSTEYMFKVSFFSDAEVLGPWEAKWVTPTSIGSPSNNKPKERKPTMNCGESKTALLSNLEKLPSSNSINESKNHRSPAHDNSSTSPKLNPPLTPFTSEKACYAGWNKEPKESDYEHSVRVIRKLEQDGYLDKDFRVKFLTWFSLKATAQERRVISVFVDTLIEDPSSLAGQLIDAFTEKIYGQQQKVASHCCSKMWK